MSEARDFNFIAFSGGVESSAMCVLYGHKADAIFADTGYEHEALYERIETMQESIRVIHGNDFTIHRVRSKHGSLEEYIRKEKYYPSFRARYCTRLFKIEPVDEFLRRVVDDHHKANLMIGLNADEADRRVGNLGSVKNVNYVYPLVEDNLTRAACQDILEHVGLAPRFPAYMQRGGCVGCFYKSKKEYAIMLEQAPGEYARIEQIEQEIQDERGEFYTIVHGMAGGFKGFREAIEHQGKLFEIEPDMGGQTQCGVFCNR